MSTRSRSGVASTSRTAYAGPGNVGSENESPAIFVRAPGGGHINTRYDVDMIDRCGLLCLDLPRAEEVRARLPEPDPARLAAERARALADPTRLTLATALREGDELCVCDLGWITSRSQNLVSHHVRVLRSAGLVTSRRDGKLVMYALTQSGRDLLSSVLHEPTDVRA